MKKMLGGILAAAVLAAALPSGAGVQADPGQGLGLRLATPDRLRGVPLAFTPYAGDELPRSVDLSPDMPPPGHQGAQNSCVGWAMAYALKSYQEKIEERQPYAAPGGVDARRVFSPSFIYNQCNGGRNVPIFYADAFNILSEQGAATWADMPYGDVTAQPSAEVRRRAGRYKIDFWRQVNAQDVKEVKSHLHAGFPVLIGANVDQAFLKLPAGTTWSSIGTVSGGHAMVVVGYDDGRGAFRLMNSWGQEWCDRGFCWVGYDHFRRVVNEAYVAKDARNGPSTVVEDKPAPPRPAAGLTLLNVSHNTTFPNRPDLGYFMRFDGALDIPAGLGRSDQIVIYFYYDTGTGMPGPAVVSADRAYADANGFAACGTQVYPVPPEGLRTSWGAWIPYGALSLPVGQNVSTPQGIVYQPFESRLFAQAVLFVDGFGVARSPLVPFFVRK